MYKISYTGDGVTCEFLFAFPFFQTADICVAVDERALTASEFGVYPNEDLTGGTVIFPVAPADGARIDIYRQVTLSRVIDYQPTAKIDPEDLNTDFNFLLAALRDVRQIDVDITQWQNTHDNVKAFLEYTNNLVTDKLGGGGAPTDVDRAVAKLIVEQIPNGACLQLGIGGMPNAVGSLIAQSDLKDLGVHTEMYVDAFVDIAMAGKINGRCKNLDKGRQVYAFAAGTKKLYDYIDRNPDVMAAPVDYTNDVRVLAQLDNFISINNAIDLDLFGQVNAESAGLKHISGTGGQLDFVMGAYLSHGGKSFICLSSTVTGKDGTVKSRIVPTLTQGSIATDPRSCVQYIVTEYGMVNLKGLSTWERAEAIISIADPQFREQLIQDAQKMGIWRRSNK